MLPFRKVILAAILATTTLLLATRPAWSQAASQDVTKIDGIPNWGQVTDMVYRGGQPTSAGYKALQRMGVAIVVDFRDESGEIASEKRDVQASGMQYYSIPWSGTSYPSNPQVLQFLDLVRANPRSKIFVHCKRGADRTGVMIAAYRIAVEQKNVADAVSEMHRYHYDHFWLPQLERYVESLPQLLTGDPLFGTYAPAPATLGSGNSKHTTPPISPAALLVAPPAQSLAIQ